MAAPPEKKSKLDQEEGMVVPPEEKESTTISMVVEKWKKGQTEQFSAVHRINGYPWRLRLFEKPNRPIGRRFLDVICDKSREAELWQCTATITTTMQKWANFEKFTRTFASWDNGQQRGLFRSGSFFTNGREIKIGLTAKEDGASWRLRPTADFFEVRDRCLVIGEEKKKIHVNKECLASQSSFFEKLFNGDFKEKNMSEIPIGDVEYEEFFNIIKMVYGFEDSHLSDENVHRVLQLSDRFDLKIVEDKAISFLLSSDSSLSIHNKLLISEQFNLLFLKEILLSRYDKNTLKELKESEEFEQLSIDTIKALFKKSCELYV